MAKPRFPGKPHRLLSRNRTRISTASTHHDDDTVDVVGNICLGLAIFKHTFGDKEEPYVPGVNGFKGFTAKEVGESTNRSKRKIDGTDKHEINFPSTTELFSASVTTNATTTIEGPKNETKEIKDDEAIGVPVSKRARRKGGGRKPSPSVPKPESPIAENFKPEVEGTHAPLPVPNVSMLPIVESPLSWVGHPLIVEGKRRWKPTYKVLQGPSSLEESRRLGGEAWPFGARQMSRAVEAPAPLGGKFVTGSGEKEQESKNVWKAGASSSGVRPSGGGILREARLRLDSAASGSEDGEWVRRMMDETEKNRNASAPESSKGASPTNLAEGSQIEKNIQENDISPARVYCRICRGAMSRRFSKRKTGKRGVWSCKACREFSAEMTKKLRSSKSGDGNEEKEGGTSSEGLLVCSGGKGKCTEDDSWPPAPAQRCVPCWLRLCLNAPAPHLIPCPVTRASLRKQLPQSPLQVAKEPGKRGKKRRGSKFVHHKSKRQKVAAEGPRVKHVCRSALAVLGRPPATFPAHGPLKAQGGEAASTQENGIGGEVNEAEESRKQQVGSDETKEEEEANGSSTSTAVNATGGAHQWWKQRKGIHRRRKKGRLSLLLPRRDGRLPLSRPMHKIIPPAKPGGVLSAVKPSKLLQVADVGPPLQLEGYPFRADAAEIFTNGYGVVQVSPNIMPIQPICFLCGSGGKQWLVHCAMCCEPFHTFCVEWAGWDVFDGWDLPIKGPPKLRKGEKFLPLEWMCRRCSLCHACGLPAYVPGGGMPSVNSKGNKVKDVKAIEKKAEEEGGDTSKKKKNKDGDGGGDGEEDDEDEEVFEDMGTRTCNICHRCYHGSCLGPSAGNQKNGELALFKDKDKPWVCSSCLRCHSCGKSSVAGSVPRKHNKESQEGGQPNSEQQPGPEDILMCAACLSLHRKGNYCPLCHVVYRDSDFDALMMQCAQCSFWVHASCEGLTDDQYHLLSLLPSSVEFTCSPCTSKACPAWRKALEKKLCQGLEKILEILDEAVQAKNSSLLLSSLPGKHICSISPMEHSKNAVMLNSSPSNSESENKQIILTERKSCETFSKDKFPNQCTKKSFLIPSTNMVLGTVNKETHEDSNNVSSFQECSNSAPVNNADILLILKNKIEFGNFGDPNDFYETVENFFVEDESILGVVRNALIKVFPWVKPKFCTKDTKEKLEILFNDHCYTSFNKSGESSKWVSNVSLSEKQSFANNVEEFVKSSPISCDLQKRDVSIVEKVKIGIDHDSECVNENISTMRTLDNENKRKERMNPNENLWMDPSDYIPNLKVYSFASALKRRSRNQNMLSLSTKERETKSGQAKCFLEKDNSVTLEHSKNIVTYKSVLAGIKKESAGNEDVSNFPEVTDIKLEKETDEASTMDDQKHLDAENKDAVNSEAKGASLTSVLDDKKELKCAIPNDKTSNSDIPLLRKNFPSLIKEGNDELQSSVVSFNKSQTAVEIQETRSIADGRRCLFCHVRGDADVECEGRLLLASSFGDWVHCNCALWSAEVYEEKGGLLMKVREAVNRGRRVRCALCRDTGATLGCCLRGCPDSFHLGCALRSGCLLLEDKSVYCRNHIPTDQKKETSVELSLKRPVQVDTEGRKGSVLWRWKKPGRTKRKPGEDGTTFAAGTLRFTVGSLHVESLGKIMPGSVQGQFIRPPEGRNKSNSEEEMRWCEGGVSLAKKGEDEKLPEVLSSGGAPVVVPVGFSCTRLYWSSVEPWKVVEYRIQTVMVITEMEEIEALVNDEKEEMSDEEHETQEHITVDHTAEAEDIDGDNIEDSHSDLIMPSELTDEILKDLPVDLFANKKLMQNFLIGFLKGANNGELQNGVSHSSFGEIEENKPHNIHKDEEQPTSLYTHLTEEGVRMPRHNRPINVVQPVSKEAMLTPETASHAWELTCEMRPAHTPPPSASPIMTGAAGSTTDLATIIKPRNKPAIWSEGSKGHWKRMRPIPQLDGNADPSSSSSEGGGSSPVRVSPSCEASQPLPCLLACRIKQQSLARSEPGGGGPVKCSECRRTYRTREGYERHLCGTPLPLSSTSSDSDSEDRTSRRVSSESDAPTLGEEAQQVETEECFGEVSTNSEKDKNLKNIVMESSISDVDKVNKSASDFSEVSVQHKGVDVPTLYPEVSNPECLMQSKIQASNFNCDVSGKVSCPSEKNPDTNLPRNEEKELHNQIDGSSVDSTSQTEVSSLVNSLDSSSNNQNFPNVYSEKEMQNLEKIPTNISARISNSKEGRDVAWKGSAADNCPSRNIKRQTAMVQPLCYVNGKRRIALGESPEVSKAALRINNVSQEEHFMFNNQEVPRGTIHQSSSITTSIPSQGNNNFQVLVRQLPSASALPQFAENFRQQTGHTLQYLATIDPASFNQTNSITPSQGLMGLIQGSPQIMQTQALVSSQQVMASSPIVLAPQQQTIMYNPVTACLEAVPTQQQGYILAPSPAPTFSIPTSTSLSYGISQDIPRVYFQSAPMPPPAPPPPVAPTPPLHLETTMQGETTGWALPAGYQLVQNQTMDHVPTLILSDPSSMSTMTHMAMSNPMQQPAVTPHEPLPTIPQIPTSPVQTPLPTLAKKKRILLPNHKLREGCSAYRRDDKTGKYIPVEDGWNESLSDGTQKKLPLNEELCLRAGLSPAMFAAEGKDSSEKDRVVGVIRRRQIAKKGDNGGCAQVVSNNLSEKKGSPMRWVRAVQTPSRWRSSSLISKNDKECNEQMSESRGCNSAELRLDGIDNASERVSSGIERISKRVESASVMYQVHSADGLTIQSDTPDKIWDQVFNTVQEARVAHGLTPLPRNPFAPMSGSKPFLGTETLALSHKGLRYLLNQLPGASQLLEAKSSALESISTVLPPHKLFSRAHLSLSTQTLVPEAASVPPPPPSSPPLPENPTGCARTEAFKCPPPLPNPTVPGEPCPSLENRKWRHRDIFGWLASPHRKLPMAPLPTQDGEPNGGGNRRATSLDLPMAMRFRHLKETSRETVGVYRSHIHGRGLFCLKDIEAGEMVIEYSGEVIRSSLTDTREKTYEAKGMGCYMFRIDEQTVVDATMRGNAARFINHSCDPNCYSRVVDILGKKHILIFALRRIPRGEELTYDYKFPFEDVKIPCHCASKRCRKYLN